ncbi:hypothetical protein QE152_g22724 [Popillia japonica]|uniref:Uncharacterized protein n=1 Tax=Popillia japonica TaxID=7064 RepID=A0AAW1KKQ4_POPJA
MCVALLHLQLMTVKASPTTSISFERCNTPQTSKKRNSSDKNLLTLATTTLRKINEEKEVTDDEFSIAGKKYAFDLRALNTEQRTIAEKIVSDVIYYGKLAQLNVNLLTLATTTLRKINEEKEVTDDEFSIAGKKYAFDLRALNTEQRTIAEKIVSDVIYYGKLAQLNVNSSINLNTPNYHQTSSTTYSSQLHHP